MATNWRRLRIIAFIAVVAALDFGFDTPDQRHRMRAGGFMKTHPQQHGAQLGSGIYLMLRAEVYRFSSLGSPIRKPSS